MRGIVKAAKIANGRNRSCVKCPIRKNHKICPPEFMEVCSNAFIKGFQKGAEYYRRHL